MTERKGSKLIMKKDKCDMCMYRVCFEWAGLAKEDRQKVIEFMTYLQGQTNEQKGD